MPLLRRYLTCWYCNTKSRTAFTPGLNQFRCTNCESINYLDSKGQITDPPVPSPPTNPLQYASQPRFPSPPPVEDNLFCSTCVKNQHILTQALAAYLPAPDDPRYAEFEASFPAHKASLEARYPQVCADCAPRVRERIRQAGYTAKTDHLRRMVERTKANPPQYRRWGWKEWLVVVARYAWWASIAGQVFVDVAGLAKTWVGYEVDLEDEISLLGCLLKEGGSLECVYYLPVNQVAEKALILGIATFWWNNKLFQKLHTPACRLVGLSEHIRLQLLVLVVRAALLWSGSFQLSTSASQAVHSGMLAFIFFVCISSWQAKMIY